MTRIRTGTFVALACLTTHLLAQTTYQVPFVNEPLAPTTMAPGNRGLRCK